MTDEISRVIMLFDGRNIIKKTFIDHDSYMTAIHPELCKKVTINNLKNERKK
jgi:hypothetical protein